MKKVQLNKKRFVFTAAVLIAAVVLVSCQSNANVSQEEVKAKKQVSVQIIQPQDQVVTTLSTSGTVVPRQYSVIRSLTPGTVEFLAPVGSEIRAGQSLFSIRDSNVENNYYNAQQSYNQTTIITQQRVSQSELNVNSSQARYQLSQSTFTNTEKQTAQSLKAARDAAIVNYDSAYNVMSQLMKFLSRGTIAESEFRYENISSTDLQLRIDTNNLYQMAVPGFLALPSSPDRENLSASFAQIIAVNNSIKLLVDSSVLLLQKSIDLPANTSGTLSGDQTTMASYQTQVNAFANSLITNQNALENTIINNELLIDQARNQLNLAEIDLRNAEVALENSRQSAQLEINAAQSQLNAASYNFNNLTLRSPFSGTVLSHYVSQGEQVSVGQELVEIGNLNIVEVSVAVDVEFAENLKLNDKVLINGTQAGVITQIEPSGNIQSGKVGVVIQSENQNSQLKAGSVAEITFESIFKQPEAIVIPIKSAKIEASGTTVLVVENGVVVKKTIMLGRVFGDRVSVESGLEAGDQLVLVDGVFVAEGDEVEIAQ